MHSDARTELDLDHNDWQTAILQHCFDATLAELRELHGADVAPARQAELREELRVICHELAARVARRWPIRWPDRM